MNSTILLGADGKLYGCGENYNAELGLGDTNERDNLIEIPVPTESRIEQVSSNNHTIVLDSEGRIYGCGLNKHGELGLGDTNSRFRLTHIPNDFRITKVVCGLNYTIVLDDEGNLHGCGWNANYELGLGDTNERHTLAPIVVPNEVRIVDVACSDHTIALDSYGRIYGCGNNENGELGLGDLNARRTLTQIPTPNEVPIKQIACGIGHTVVLDSEGNAHGCGDNMYGQLGVDGNGHQILTQIPTLNGFPIIQIGCGFEYTIALDSEGNLHGCGSNDYSTLGQGDNDNQYNLTTIPTHAESGITQIDCRNSTIILLDSEGNVYGCGWNSYGQLGLGDINDRESVILIPTPCRISRLTGIVPIKKPQCKPAKY